MLQGFGNIRQYRAPMVPYSTADTDYLAYIWHDGSPFYNYPSAGAGTYDGTPINSATITATANTSITLKASNTTTATVDNRIGASGVMALTTYTTWGAVADHINSVKGWHCVLGSALRTDATKATGYYVIALGETSCLRVAVAVHSDTSAAYSMGTSIVMAGLGKNTMYGHVPLLYSLGAYLTSASSPMLYIYDCDDISKRVVPHQPVFQYLLTTATAFTYPTYGTGQVPIYVAPPGHRIVVLARGGAVSTGADYAYASGAIIQL